MALGRTSTRGRMRNAAMQRASQQRAVAQQRSPEAFNQALNRKMESIPEVRALKSFGASIGNRQPTPQELQKLQSLQTAVQNNAAFKAIERESRAFETQNQQRMQAQNATRTISQKSPNLVAAPQKPAAMPKQAAGQMAAFNAAQNKNTQGSFMDYAAQRVMQQFNQAPAAARAPAQQAQQSPNLAAYNASQQGAMNTAAIGAARQRAMNQFNQTSAADALAQQKATTQQRRTVPQQAALVPQTQPKPTPDMSAIAAPAVLTPEQRQAVMRGERPTAPPAMRKGGAVNKKPGYAKGGMVMANCGASMKPQQKAKK